MPDHANRTQKKQLLISVDKVKSVLYHPSAMNDLEVVLIREDLLTTLAAGHTLLLLLAELGGRKLGLLLGGDDLVAHGVELLLLLTIVLLETGTRALTLDPVVAGRSHLAVHDSPDFLSQVLGELGGVSNDDDTTLELLEGLGKGTKRVTIEIVGRLIKDNQVRTLPRAGGKDDLDTLTTGETAHAGVRNKFGIETEVGAVRLNLLANKGTELTRGEGLLHIDLSNHLLVRSEKLVTGQPSVVSGHHGDPALVLHANVLAESERALVLVGVLELSTSVNANDTTVSTLDLEDLVHGLLIGLGDDLVGTIHGFTILTSLETPLDVLGGSLVEVVIDVGESVLLDVGNTDVLVLVDLTGGGDELTSEDVDEGGLAGTVGANDGNTGAERALEGDIGNLGLGGTGVLEGHLGGTENGLGLGLDTLEETGLGEGELHLGGTELVVGLGRGNASDEVLEVTTVTLELEALVVDNVLAHIVEEARVVRDDDGSARGGLEVILEPLNVLDIQMVSRLIEEKNIGSLEDGTAQSELHLPTTGKSGDVVLDHIGAEAELSELGLDISLGGLDTSLLELLHGPVDSGHLSIGGVKIVLNEDSLDLRLLGETLDLLVVDGAHEGGLAGTVGTAKTVALATLETKVGLVEKNLGTVGKGEGAVAKILTLLLISLSLIGLSGTGGSLLAEGIGESLGLSVTDDDSEVGLNGLGPDGGLGGLLIDELTGNGGNVLDDSGELLDSGGVLAAKDLLKVAKDDVDIAGVASLGDFAIDNVTNAGKGVKSLLGLLTGLRISEVVVVLLETGHHLGQERSNDVGVVDELAHVVDNDSGLTLDGGVALSKTTIKERNHEGKSGLLNLSDESGGTEQVNGLGDVLGLGDTLDELGNETLNITVDNKLAELLHGLVGALLDLLLGIPHGLRDDRDEVGDTETELDGSGADEGIDEVEGGHLLGPLLGVADSVDERGEGGLDGVGVDGLGDGKSSSNGGVLDSGNLVTSGSEDAGEERDQVGLNMGGNLGVLSDSLDGRKSLLASGGILLVGELLLERLDSLDGSIKVLDATVDERGNSGGSLLDGIGLVGDGELLHELIKNLEALGVLLGGHDD